VQLTPRYDGPSILCIQLPLDDLSVPFIRQRRRLGKTLADFDDSQWSAPSRCEAWSVQDVITHLVGTNQFWNLSISSGLKGSPTQFLATFDPVVTPADMVERERSQTSAEVLERYLESVEQLAATVDGMSEEAWLVPAEAPPGHVEMRAVVLHAMWDAWIHERDILLPLGLDQAVEADEIYGCLVYASGISPTLLAASGSARGGVIGVVAQGPDASFVVEAGTSVVIRPRNVDDRTDVELRGPAVELIEGLTFRAPLDCDVPADARWLLGGLAEVFDRV
jgi:uncharacterized protein (TIGR03083 family)